MGGRPLQPPFGGPVPGVDLMRPPGSPPGGGDSVQNYTFDFPMVGEIAGWENRQSGSPGLTRGIYEFEAESRGTNRWEVGEASNQSIGARSRNKPKWGRPRNQWDGLVWSEIALRGGLRTRNQRNEIKRITRIAERIRQEQVKYIAEQVDYIKIAFTSEGRTATLESIERFLRIKNMKQ